MASPFPGMNPYLEDRSIWPGFHHSLAEEIRAMLNAQIGPKYYADVEVRTVLEDVSIARPQPVIPDVGVVERPSREMTGVMVADIAIAPAPVERFAIADETRLRTINVYLTGTDELVTVIEILSPYNKHGEGREEYRQKRSRLLRTRVHLVEVDLLRGGYPPGGEVVNPSLPGGDYVLLVNRHQSGDPRRLSEIWPAFLNQPLPVIPVPLLDPDPDAPLDLNAAIRSVYARAGYDWRLDYSRPVPDPPLRAEMVTWLDQRLSECKQQNLPSN
jgi:hypothetical protein